MSGQGLHGLPQPPDLPRPRPSHKSPPLTLQAPPYPAPNPSLPGVAPLTPPPGCASTGSSVHGQLTSARQVTAAGLGAAGCSDAPAEREAAAADILLLKRAEPWRPEPFGLAGEEKGSPER